MRARTLSAFVLGAGLLAAVPAAEATPNCAVHPNSRLVQWPTASPVWEILRVRGGQFHQANELDDCGISVYTLEPFGDWTP